MRLLCPAKLNLHLRVGPRRDDGFHSLLSWFCTVGLFDALILEYGAQSAPSPAIALRCDRDDIPSDQRNLVVKVAEAWAGEARQTSGSQVCSIEAALHKRIPAGAGLGGGSSDGAKALLGLNALWRANRSAKELSAFAGRFGSDLPFFFHGPSSICTGRGEIVRPIARPKPRWALLMLPPIHMPTAEVYKKFDAMRLGLDEDIAREPDWDAWTKLDVRQLLEGLINDLEAPAFAINPALARIRQDAEKLLGRPVRMSGSGSSLFTLYDTEEEANAARLPLSSDKNLGRVESVALTPDFTDDLTTPLGG